MRYKGANLQISLCLGLSMIWVFPVRGQGGELIPVPSRNLAYMKPVIVSNATPETPPAFAVDGDRDTYWGAGGHPPQWIEVDLQTPVDIERINLITSQYPEGQTVHKVWGKASGEDYELLLDFCNLGQS